MFNLIGLGEHAGSGVPDIYKAWRDVGLEAPVVEEKVGEGKPDRTILTLPLISAGRTAGKSAVFPTVLKYRHRQILDALKSDIEYSSDEVAKLIGLKGSRTRELLNELVKLEKIEPIGGTRGRRYKKI